MTRELICARPDSPVEPAEELMSEFQVKRLPVRDECGLQGIITQTDIALTHASADVPVDAEGASEIVSAPPTRRVAAAGGDYRCAECGYSVTVRRDLIRCPMCGTAAWVRIARPMPWTNDGW